MYSLVNPAKAKIQASPWRAGKFVMQEQPPRTQRIQPGSHQAHRKFDSTWRGGLVLLFFLAFLAPLAVLINLAGYRGQVLSGRDEATRYF
jgi:hypothetical protein